MKKHFNYLLITVLYTLFIANVYGQPPSLLNQSIKKQVIDTLVAQLKTNYVFLDTAVKMGNLIKHRLTAGAYDTIKTPAVFAATLKSDLLSVYHDGHLSVDYRPDFGNAGNSETEKQRAERRLKFRKQVNFGFEKAEILEGNVAVLRIDGFFAPDNDGKEIVRAAIRFVSNCDKLIIDLRNNHGGDPGMVTYICGYLFKERTHLNDLYERKSNSLNTFWTTPDTSLNLGSVPIYVLTSKETFSGGEEMSYDLQTQKRAVIIGEATGGGAHPVRPFTLGNGFAANIPFARAVNPITKTNWESVGVKPDIACTADKALEVALEKIKGGR